MSDGTHAFRPRAASLQPAESSPPVDLPEGVEVRALDVHTDDRGQLFELYRSQWCDRPAVQWNCVSSRANSLRGVHAHVDHEDQLIVATGRMMLGLHDLRPGSRTFGRGCLLQLSGERPESVRLSVGVAHGFYFPVASTLLYGLTDYWSLDDELGCHWSDPALGIPWPDCDPILSPRDRNAGSLSALHAAFRRERGRGDA